MTALHGQSDSRARVIGGRASLQEAAAYVESVEAEVERLREANVALRQALVRIEDHARQLGDDALAGVALIARDAINKNG